VSDAPPDLFAGCEQAAFLGEFINQPPLPE